MVFHKNDWAINVSTDTEVGTVYVGFRVTFELTHFLLCERHSQK